MPRRNFDGGEFVTLVKRIIESDFVEIKDALLQRKLSDALTNLETEISEDQQDYEPEDQTTYDSLADYFDSVSGKEEEEVEVEVDDDEDEDEDVEFADDDDDDLLEDDDEEDEEEDKK